MPLQSSVSSSNPLCLSEVRAELGLSSSTRLCLNDSRVRGLAGKPSSGAICLSDLLGKAALSPGIGYATYPKNPTDFGGWTYFQKHNLSNDGISLVTGSITTQTLAEGGTTNVSGGRAYHAGGQPDFLPNTNLAGTIKTVRRFIYSTEAGTNSLTNLTTARSFMGVGNSSTQGYYIGGARGENSTRYYTNTTEKISFSTEATSVSSTKADTGWSSGTSAGTFSQTLLLGGSFLNKLGDTAIANNITEFVHSNETFGVYSTSIQPSIVSKGYACEPISKLQIGCNSSTHGILFTRARRNYSDCVTADFTRTVFYFSVQKISFSTKTVSIPYIKTGESTTTAGTTALNIFLGQSYNSDTKGYIAGGTTNGGTFNISGTGIGIYLAYTAEVSNFNFSTDVFSHAYTSAVNSPLENCTGAVQTTTP